MRLNNIIPTFNPLEREIHTSNQYNKEILENNLQADYGIYIDTYISRMFGLLNDKSNGLENLVAKCTIYSLELNNHYYNVYLEAKLPIYLLLYGNNILITMNTKSLDSYINGKLVKTCVLPSPPLVDTTSPVYVTPSGGFSGFTSKFNYWNDSVNPQQAWNVYKKGPGGNFLTSFIKQYKIQLSFLKGSDVQASLTI
jgi:hypothetical protein